MKGAIVRVCWLGAGVLALAGAGLAQQRFPGRSGDWEFTAKSGSLPNPMVVRMCLNDETWAKAVQNPYCKMQEIAVTSRGWHYKLDCDMRSGKSQGDVDLTFDGPAHMIGKSTMTTTMQGKTTSMVMQLDYRWKGATCSDVDLNIKKKSED
jgi:hypothetical protein